METMTADHFASLAKRSLFVGLTDEQLRLVLEAGQVAHFDPGQVIISEGESGEALYAILDGAVEIWSEAGTPRQARHLAVLRGDLTAGALFGGYFFGEMAVLDFEPISATVTAIEPCELLIIPVPALFDVFQHDRDIHVIVISNLARTLSRRLRLANEKNHEESVGGSCRRGSNEGCGNQWT
jgi:CRP-like cAMP-binding protein